MPRRKSLDDGQLTDTNYYILLSLTTPTHGYRVMQKVKDLSGGSFVIGPASLYTSLKKLIDVGLIRPFFQTNNKKIYQITDAGLDFLFHDLQRRKKMVLHGESVLEKLK